MITLDLNGEKREFDVDPDMPLLWAVRDTAGLTGTKYGCGKALCGACTVHVDGTPARSCSVTIAAVSGRKITTIEGLHSEAGRAIQHAWLDQQVPQCGFCQSGMVMAATALLERNRKPNDDEIDRALRDNICRCATYSRIRSAIRQAATALENGGDNE